MSLHLFFPSYDAYRQWIKRTPGVFPTYEMAANDPHDEYFPDLEGPYYLTPAYLVLRVAGAYCAIQRVESAKSADFMWYVSTPEQRDRGERVYAAYVWDRRTTPPTRIEAPTLEQAGQRLTSYLQATSGRRSSTEFFSRNENL